MKGEVDMPQVLLDGDVRLRDVFDKMKPLIREDEHVILRTLKKYIDGEEKSSLTEALVIEKGRKNRFPCFVKQ